MGEMNQSAQSTKAASSAEKVRDPQTYEIIGVAMEYHRLILGFKHQWKDNSDRA
jgi:hypothetical protein